MLITIEGMVGEGRTILARVCQSWLLNNSNNKYVAIKEPGLPIPEGEFDSLIIIKNKGGK